MTANVLSKETMTNHCKKTCLEFSDGDKDFDQKSLSVFTNQPEVHNKDSPDNTYIDCAGPVLEPFIVNSNADWDKDRLKTIYKPANPFAFFMY